MAYKRISIHQTEEEVVAAVEQLKIEGFTKEEMSLIVNDNEDTSWLKKKTNVTPETETNDGEGSFMDKVKDVFTGDGNNNEENNYFERFRDLGLTDEEARELDTVVRNGKIVLIAEDHSGTQNDISANPGESSAAGHRRRDHEDKEFAMVDIMEKKRNLGK